MVDESAPEMQGMLSRNGDALMQVSCISLMFGTTCLESTFVCLHKLQCVNGKYCAPSDFMCC